MKEVKKEKITEKDVDRASSELSKYFKKHGRLPDPCNPGKCGKCGSTKIFGVNGFMLGSRQRQQIGYKCEACGHLYHHPYKRDYSDIQKEDKEWDRIKNIPLT